MTAVMSDTPSARAYLEEMLRRYGLQDLASWANDELAKGFDDVVVLQHLREQPLYRQRFKAIFEREKAGLPAMSPAEVIEYEARVTELMINAGFPKGFYDSPDDFAALMIADKSLEEIKDRVIGGYAKVAQAPRLVRDTFREFYGVDGDAALAAFFLDPDKAMPLLEVQLQAGSIGGVGRRFGIQTGRDTAEELARMGITEQAADQTYGQLAASSGLFKENVDETKDIAIDKEGVAAAFGTDQAARQEVSRRAEGRLAAFAGSGGASSSQQGASGLGAANKP